MAGPEASGDGLGTFNAKQASASGTGEETELGALVDRMLEANGTATTVTNAASTAIKAQVYRLFGATDKGTRDSVDKVLTLYFAVHGTSPDTDWTNYGNEYPIVGPGGRKVSPKAVVDEIGLQRLKKFMGQFSESAMSMVRSSSKMRAALAERTARAGLQPGQEHLAIDFVGKNGCLSAQEMATRQISRDRSLHYRTMNAYSVSELRGAGARETQRDARAVGSGGRGGQVMSFDT